MKKYNVSKEELIEHLKDQIEFIINSAISYDKGFEGEAKRLAVAIRVLVHDTTNSSALLAQLNKMNILFYDSANVFDPNNLLTSNCLTMMRLSPKKEGDIGVKGDYVAHLDDVSDTKNKDRKVGFNRWWKTNVILKDRDNNIFHRKDIVLAMANKEGGAHVDKTLDQAYANLTKFNALAWKVVSNDDIKDMGNPIPPSIRQIAHEILKTLKDGVMDLFPDKETLLQRFEEYDKHCKQLSVEHGFIKEVSHVLAQG